MDVSYLMDQIARSNAVLTSQTNTSVCFFPAGRARAQRLQTASAEGMTAVLWSEDAHDWKQPDHITAEGPGHRRCRNRCRHADAPIVLLHSAQASFEKSSRSSPLRGNSVAAVPQIIEWYATDGYQFVDLTGGSIGD